MSGWLRHRGLARLYMGGGAYIWDSEGNISNTGGPYCLHGVGF